MKDFFSELLTYVGIAVFGGILIGAVSLGWFYFCFWLMKVA